ncbi:MAG TPA: TRIC cation channel family protein [Phycisphaerales bacterium]|nr:TRIC cation channel family protein [Phycisphaerales bacterium]
MPPEIYVFDILGTFTFAAYGAYVGQRKRFDIFGILICAFLTALGGGTIRELILGNMLFYFPTTITSTRRWRARYSRSASIRRSTRSTSICSLSTPSALRHSR